MNRPEQRDPYSGYVAVACITCAVFVVAGIALMQVAGWTR